MEEHKSGDGSSGQVPAGSCAVTGEVQTPSEKISLHLGHGEDSHSGTGRWRQLGAGGSRWERALEVLSLPAYPEDKGKTGTPSG